MKTMKKHKIKAISLTKWVANMVLSLLLKLYNNDTSHESIIQYFNTKTAKELILIDVCLNTVSAIIFGILFTLLNYTVCCNTICCNDFDFWLKIVFIVVALISLPISLLAESLTLEFIRPWDDPYWNYLVNNGEIK